MELFLQSVEIFTDNGFVLEFYQFDTIVLRKNNKNVFISRNVFIISLQHNSQLLQRIFH